MKQPELVTPEQREQYLKKEAERIYGRIEEAVRCYSKEAGRFGLSRLGLRNAHIPKLIELVNSKPEIDNLFLSYNNIGNQGILLLARGLKYVQKLSLHATNLCNDDPNIDETLIALAQSNIRHLILSGTVLTNENIDLFLTHSKQTKINLEDIDDVDEEHIDKAKQKANENSAAFLRMTLLGESSAKRAKKGTDSDLTLSPDSLDNSSNPKK